MAGFQRSRWFAPTLLALSGGWAIAITGAPALSRLSGAGTALASTVNLGGSLVCHQLADRSFQLGGGQLPVCARCTGLYVGGALGVAIWLLWRGTRRGTARPIDPKRAVRMLLLAATPTALTWAAAVAGLGDLSNLGRAMLALPLGAAAGAVLAAVASNDLS